MTGQPPLASPIPVPDIVRAAWVDLVVTDLDRARAFWIDLIGFHETAADADTLWLRGTADSVHHSLVLRRGATPACRAIGLRVRSDADLDAVRAFHEARGCRVDEIPAGTQRGVGRMMRVDDPFGFTVEYVHHMDQVERLLMRWDLHHGAEVARLDHINLSVPDVAAAHAHYTALGFGTSETIEGPDHLYAAWMYRKPSVHDIALTEGNGPRLHHVGYAVPESSNILRLADIVAARDEPWLERGPGRHGVSAAFYLYLRDPDGHRVEVYTTDYFTGDPDHPTLRWSIDDPRRRDFWGGAVVPSWYTEAMEVLDLDGRIRPTADPASPGEVVVGADGLG